MIEAPGITINNVKITPDQINAEVQYHPADNLSKAKYEAMQSLVIRELLIQRAAEVGLCNADDVSENPDEIFEELFEKEINVPNADIKTCETFYDNNKANFFTSPLFEAAHILYLAAPDDSESQKNAFDMAAKTLVRIQENSDLFEKIAKSESACDSAKIGGHLGQITKGQTTPIFEKTLFNMKEGDISTEPLKSEYGYHLIKVYKRIEGKQLPFETVSNDIADDLQRQSWQRAFSQYIQLLAGQAKISGFILKKSDTPLVQ